MQRPKECWKGWYTLMEHTRAIYCPKIKLWLAGVSTQPHIQLYLPGEPILLHPALVVHIPWVHENRSAKFFACLRVNNVLLDYMGKRAFRISFVQIIQRLEDHCYVWILLLNNFRISLCMPILLPGYKRLSISYPKLLKYITLYLNLPPTLVPTLARPNSIH